MLFDKNNSFKPYASVRSLEEAYSVAVNNVINSNVEVVTEDGEHTLQSPPFTICIEQPWYYKYIHKNSPYGKEFYKKYAYDIVNGTSGHFVYDYHTRLFNYVINYYNNIIATFVEPEIYNPILDEHIDQINYIVEKLIEEPTSRRALAITWQPYIDEVKKDVPCLQYVQCWIENDKVNIYFMMRSNDILLAMPQNIFGFHKLHYYISKKVGKSMGKMYYSVVIPHIYYKRDANEFSKWL